MEAKHREEKDNMQHSERFDELRSIADANEISETPGFTLPIVTWWNPTPLSKAEKYQVSSILFSFQLSFGISTEEFKELISQTEPWKGDSYLTRFKNGDSEYETCSIVQIFRLNFVEKDSTITEQLRQQCIRLILVTLEMFAIPVEYYIRVQKGAWGTDKTENQQ